MIPDHLRIQPGQEALTPEQEAEAERFAGARIAAQLATLPVDEPEAERLLRHAYVMAALPPPTRLLWVDGPRQLVAALAPQHVETSILVSLWERVWGRVNESVEVALWKSVEASVYKSVEASVTERVRESVLESVLDSVAESERGRVLHITKASVRAYDDAPQLAFFRFFDEYLEPNEFHALAHFNELVSGYWVGQEEALLVRRPRMLACDPEGRLHSAAGMCMEYHDGWGFSAWHGVRVPEQVILTPERLTREDFRTEPNVEVRRVIQERMGARFVSELGGVVLDVGPRGTLYEVALLGDPEGVARYVQVQDASTERRYCLRVPPTIQTAAEAVAWGFGLSSEAYAPKDET